MRNLTTSMRRLLVATLIVSTAVGCGQASFGPRAASKNTGGAPPPKKTLRPFRSEQEMAGYFRQLAEEQKRTRARRAEAAGASMNATAAAQPAAEAQSGVAADSPDSKAKSGDESITNVQHAGVDEGGIVKVHGDHLVVLRRGRLFTVAVGDNQLRPVSSVDAYAPDLDPGGTWYDEMLVSGDTVVVIGYSYERGGTEIGLFDIDRAGGLSYRATYHLRSNDYYSSRNYSSRLIGDKLIFYTPLYLPLWQDDVTASLPAMRKWHKGATDSEWRRIAPASRVYRAERMPRSSYGLALHTVTVCDLGARPDLSCDATAVVGPPGNVFYVSPASVYVWASQWGEDDGSRRGSVLYRLPLDGSAPSALKTSGSPVDQFSFLEGEDGHLNVLVRSEGGGDGMWRAEVSEGDVALMRVPVGSFSDGGDAVPASSYRPLPKPAGDSYSFQNRFVGDYLLYGTGNGWGEQQQTKRGALYAVRLPGGSISTLPLAHGVDRIEAMGRDAVVVGADGKNLHFTSVRLGGLPSVAQTYTRADASQGELRSQGFFYKPDGEEAGLLGLPIREAARPGYEHLFEGSASVLYLRNDALRLKEVGALDARPDKSTANDSCRASCVDWYGNARPLFLRGRVFALLGYEIVEGAIDDDRIRETRRVSFAPRAARTATR